MIISASTDYREAARRRLPPFLFHYIDGGAYAEHTLRRNVSDLADVALRQRILRNMSDLTIGTELWGEKLDLPLVLADKSQLETAVMNLAVNARDAMRGVVEPGAGVVTIALGRIAQPT